MNDVEKGQLCDATMSAIYYGCSKLDSIPALIRRIIENRAWECRQVKMRGVVQLANLREMITRKPMEGWGEDPDRIESLIRNDPETLVMWREAMKCDHDRGNQYTGGKDDNVMPANQGNSRSYTVSRLQREAPALFKQVVAKTLSANAAAIQAGFRKKPTVVDQFAALWKKANKEQRDAFLASIGAKI
jgi:hypothetical protein